MLAKFRWMVVTVLCWVTTVQADIYVKDFSPQGEVLNFQQAVVQFTEDMVKLGDASAPAPFQVRCPMTGQGRWEDARTWHFTLPRALAAGERCQFMAKTGVKGLSGESLYLDGQAYVVTAPGPWILNISPSHGQMIEEDQAFIFTTREPVNLQSVAQFAWCEAEGVGERIPVKVLPPATLNQLVKTLGYQAANIHRVAVQCSRPLPADMKIKLVWGRGIKTNSGAALLDNSIFTYKVRPPFQARFGCERERANAACSPLSNLWLDFTSPISRELAAKIRLVGKNGEQSPDDWSDEYKAARQKLGTPLVMPEQKGGSNVVDRITFKGPFPANSEFSLTLPKNFKDITDRPLNNATQFPLKTRVTHYPPLVKFAADFGILEHQEGGLLPVTVRNVEANLKMRVLRESSEAAMVKTWLQLEKFEAQTQRMDSPKRARGAAVGDDEDTHTDYDPYYPRELSYLQHRKEATSQSLPKPSGAQAFEVIGIPLTKTGFYVVEVESALLGKSLLATAKPMYVRTQALVTDLSVHFKKGRDNSLVWVTSLSTSKPVPNASVTIYTCHGNVAGRGKTDALGRALLPVNLSNNEADCNGYLVTARAGEDFSLVHSDWNKGIEPWRFNLPTWDSISSPKIHTVLDRSLFRAGETVSMKHIARLPKAHGFSYPHADQLPKTLTLRSYGINDEPVSLPLVWDARGVATTQWKIPSTAKLGSYAVEMGDWNVTAEFRVSEFRLPKFKGSVQSARVSNSQKIPTRLSLSYLNGGMAAGQNVQISSMLSEHYLDFPRYRDYTFDTDYDGAQSTQNGLILDKHAVVLDKQGAAKLDITLPKKILHPMQLRSEMTFNDPSGEVHTIAGITDIWPAEIAVGMSITDEANAENKHLVKAITLDINGKPRAGIEVRVTGEHAWQFVHRKRILGGFYSYETEDHRDDLGTLCNGKTNDAGIFSCWVTAKQAGEIKLRVRAEDGKGGVSVADNAYFNSNDGDFWFEQADQDRMDVIADKREYQPGDIARLQVHTPFHEATALITVEREGVVESFVRTLRREDATLEIPVGENWGPNVFVSVLAVRGRVYDVPWYSFFQWGWRSPAAWWKAWRANSHTPQQITAMVDLAKPAFKLGITRLDVGLKGARLNVEVNTDKAVYAPRSVATVKLRVHLPNGKPAPAGSEVMLAAVDKALLELAPNKSWALLEAMMQERAYLMETATAQMQVVGKRHFGKKALPAGGGGGRASSRELFDTLLYWNARVKLDAQGMATISVPLNDSLTAFKIVAVADVGTSYFGTGSAEITATQPVQMTAALPPLVREGDSYQAMMSVRNTTSSNMTLTVEAVAGTQILPAQPLTLAAGAAQEVSWRVTVPGKSDELPWQIKVVDAQGKVWDSLKLSQKIQPRIPVTTQQAMFMRLEQPYRVPVVLPDGALVGQGGIEVRLSAQLAAQTDGIRRFFQDYPYSCLEQKVSIAAGLQDAQRWETILQNLGGYLDAQGLAQYFPGAGHGSESLTAYLLVMATENAIALPPTLSAKMEKGLLDFVEGRGQPISMPFGNRDYLLERRLHALAALAYRGKVTGRMLTAYDFKPLKLPTATLIDWYALLRRVADAPQRAERLAQVEREVPGHRS